VRNGTIPYVAQMGHDCSTRTANSRMSRAPAARTATSVDLRKSASVEKTRPPDRVRRARRSSAVGGTAMSVRGMPSGAPVGR
jgi:hypothetical protein